VQSFISGLELAPNTVRVVMQHLSAVFATALDDGLIGGRNPCAGVRLPRVDNAPVLPLTTEQVSELLDQADDWFATAIVIGAGLGLRQSETTGLTIDRVDFLRRVVTVDRQWQPASGSHVGTFADPKTESSTGVIPADEWVLERLAAHVKNFGTGAGGVIVRYDGKSLDAAKFGHYVRMARNRAGLRPNVSFHGLRHFFASALINARCSVKQVQLALGHKSAKVTLDVYGHLWPGEEDRVRDAIGRVFRPSAEFSRTSRKSR
jgi:integrase